MDEIRNINTIENILEYINRAKENLSPDFLLILLGPTASGKTKLSVSLAKELNAEIISADSRQVYKNLNIGSGKDLEEYRNIPYHLIDIIEPKEKYSVKEFRKDFFKAYDEIRSKNKQAILCGGTGSYIQSILQQQPYSEIPKNEGFELDYLDKSKEEIIEILKKKDIPKDFNIDWNNKKRLIRALEILEYLEINELPSIKSEIIKDYVVIGLNPNLNTRREKIDIRLVQRIEQGMIKEVEDLISSGLSHEQIQWFGLEYKYISYYLLGLMSKEEFKDKLKTEIHRFAKRQMTYFRKMEKDGIKIHWIDID